MHPLFLSYYPYLFFSRPNSLALLCFFHPALQEKLVFLPLHKSLTSLWPFSHFSLILGGNQLREKREEALLLSVTPQPRSSHIQTFFSYVDHKFDQNGFTSTHMDQYIFIDVQKIIRELDIMARDCVFPIMGKSLNRVSYSGDCDKNPFFVFR